MKNVERALVATGVALVLSGGAASAAILANSASAVTAPQTGGAVLAATQIGALDPLANNGRRGGADLMTAAATYIGIAPADLRTQLAAGKSLADVAVANGKTRDGLIVALTAAQQQSIATLVDQKGVANPGKPGGGGPGHDGRGGARVQGDPIAAAATFLGITAADIDAKQDSGQTLAQIATAAGKTRDALIQALVNDAKTKIDAARAAGTITADQATTLQNGLTDRITKLVDAVEAPGR
ncbi:MAG TPA: hypothetical protein VGA38_07100 [Candidatus Limnocylindria bacterium]